MFKILQKLTTLISPQSTQATAATTTTTRPATSVANNNDDKNTNDGISRKRSVCRDENHSIPSKVARTNASDSNNPAHNNSINQHHTNSNQVIIVQMFITYHANPIILNL